MSRGAERDLPSSPCRRRRHWLRLRLQHIYIYIGELACARCALTARGEQRGRSLGGTHCWWLCEVVGSIGVCVFEGTNWTSQLILVNHQQYIYTIYISRPRFPLHCAVLAQPELQTKLSFANKNPKYPETTRQGRSTKVIHMTHFRFVRF